MLRQNKPIARYTRLKRTAIKRRPRRRKSTKEDKDYMAWVATLPCSVLDLHCKGRITVHHCQGHPWRGMGQKAKDTETFPLCEGHHLFGKYSIEGMGIRAWERIHGDQEDHLEKTQQQRRLYLCQKADFE